MQPPMHAVRDTQTPTSSTPPPVADLHGPLADWGPAPRPTPRQAGPPRPRPGDVPVPAADGDIQAWVQFLRTMEAVYGRHAAAAGEPLTPLTDAECLAAAHLASALGVTPDAAAADRLTDLLCVA